MLETATDTELACHYAHARETRAEAFANLGRMIRSLFSKKGPRFEAQPFQVSPCVGLAEAV